MASHHHCHHQQQESHHHHHESTCFSCCYTPCPPPQHLSYPPPQPTDPLLLQALASQLLHQQSQQQQHEHLFTQYIHKPNPPPQKQDQPKTQALLASLVRRINALESSLSQHNTPHSRASNLRDIAARTIQTHFRAYLVRRSQTLRNLKHLANIKSSFKYLKSCISSNPHFNSDTLSQKAMDLLHKLESIQGGDPMIRDGKRSISRELVQFMEFLDGVTLKRQQLYSKSMRRVRFAEENNEPYACEDVDVMEGEEGVPDEEQRELVENLCKKIENIEGRSRVYEDDNEEETSRNPRSNLQNQKKGSPYFSAPVPVQMEPDLMKREKIVRVAR